MVVIEPEPEPKAEPKPKPPIEENNKAVDVSSNPKTKPKPDQPSSSSSSSTTTSTTTTTLESRDDDDTRSAAAAGYSSDGFETASESEFDDGHDEHQQQSVPPPNDVESEQKALAEANDAKLEGNRLFGDGNYEEALSKYEFALQIAPEMASSSVELRSICYANRGTCFVKLGKFEDAIKECTKALELNPKYVKALFRRGEAHEKLEHFEEAIADMKKILEADASNVQAERIIRRLEPLANAKREKMKEEMIGKLKELGNSVLGKFGMSVDNLKAVQDPKTGSYSVSFQR